MIKIRRVLLSVLLAVLCFAQTSTVARASSSVILIGSKTNMPKDGEYYSYNTAANQLGSDVGISGNWNVHYDAASNKLTLKNLVLNKTDLFIQKAIQGTNVDICIGIYINSTDPITIDIEGTNSVTLINPKKILSLSTLYNIYLVGTEQHITGTGTLNSNATADQPDLEKGVYPSAFALNNASGVLYIENGTINASATGVFSAIGIGGEGLNEETSNAEPSVIQYSNSDFSMVTNTANDSLYIKGGNVNAIGTSVGADHMEILSRGTGIASFGAAYVAGGSIHATGIGQHLGMGFISANGIQFSGGDSVFAGESTASGALNLAFHVMDGFYQQFDPRISLINGQTILETKTASGNEVTDTGINRYTIDNVKYYTIGPAGGDAATDVAVYAHIGPASVPASTPAASTSSGWVPSYEIQLKNCSGKVISDQWVAEGQPVTIPSGYTYGEEELNWVYRNLTVSPTSCKVTGYVVPNTADKG